MNAPLDRESEMANLDRISREYQQPDGGRRVDQKLISLIAGRAISWMTGPEVLEMGSGDDQWTKRLIKQFGHLHLVDGSRTLIEAARRKYGAELTTYHSLFEDLNPGKQFDTVLSSLVLEHVADPVRVLAKAAQWLKPDGQLIVIVPNGLSLHRRLAVATGFQRAADELGESDIRLGHRWVFTIEGIEGESIMLSLSYPTAENARPVFVSTGSACVSGTLEPSHILLALGLPAELAHGSVRISLSRHNTREDADYALDSLFAVSERLRSMSPVYKRGSKQCTSGSGGEGCDCEAAS